MRIYTCLLVALGISDMALAADQQDVLGSTAITAAHAHNSESSIVDTSASDVARTLQSDESTEIELVKRSPRRHRRKRGGGKKKKRRKGGGKRHGKKRKHKKPQRRKGRGRKPRRGRKSGRSDRGGGGGRHGRKRKNGGKNGGGKKRGGKKRGGKKRGGKKRGGKKRGGTKGGKNTGKKGRGKKGVKKGGKKSRDGSGDVANYPISNSITSRSACHNTGAYFDNLADDKNFPGGYADFYHKFLPLTAQGVDGGSNSVMDLFDKVKGALGREPDTLMYTLELPKENGVQLSDIDEKGALIMGAFHELIANTKVKVLLRILHEMNSPVYFQGGNPVLYKKVFTQIASAARDVAGKQRLRTIYSPISPTRETECVDLDPSGDGSLKPTKNTAKCEDTREKQYRPVNEDLVDMCGMTLKDTTFRDHEFFEKISFKYYADGNDAGPVSFYNSKFCRNKPFILSEVSAPGGSDAQKADWLHDMYYNTLERIEFCGLMEMIKGPNYFSSTVSNFDSLVSQRRGLGSRFQGMW